MLVNLRSNLGCRRLEKIKIKHKERKKKKKLTGSGVGMLAFGSPMLAQAITPPLMTISGFAPKNDGFHRTRSANFPTCKPNSQDGN